MACAHADKQAATQSRRAGANAFHCPVAMCAANYLAANCCADKNNNQLVHVRQAFTLPALACTTSVPPSWVRLVRASMSASLNLLAALGTACSWAAAGHGRLGHAAR